MLKLLFLISFFFEPHISKNLFLSLQCIYIRYQIGAVCDYTLNGGGIQGGAKMHYFQMEHIFKEWGDNLAGLLCRTVGTRWQR